MKNKITRLPELEKFIEEAYNLSNFSPLKLKNGDCIRTIKMLKDAIDYLYKQIKRNITLFNLISNQFKIGTIYVNLVIIRILIRCMNIIKHNENGIIYVQEIINLGKSYCIRNNITNIHDNELSFDDSFYLIQAFQTMIYQIDIYYVEARELDIYEDSISTDKLSKLKNLLMGIGEEFDSDEISTEDLIAKIDLGISIFFIKEKEGEIENDK